MQQNSNSLFFNNKSQNLENKTPLLLTSNHSKNIKNKNFEFMVNIRKSDRKDIIRNSRFRNVRKLTETQNPQITLLEAQIPPGSLYPEKLSHLPKVKDAERIFQILKDIQNVQPDPANLKGYLDLIRNGSRIQKHQAIIYLRKLLSNLQNLPIQETIDLNGVPLLMKLANNTSELHLRMEATWCLANLVSGNTQQTKTLISKNIIKLFDSILEDPYPQIVEQAIWGLGNIIGDSVELREKVVEEGILKKFLVLLNTSQNKNVQKQLVWCISNALRIRPKRESCIKRQHSVVALICAFNTFNEISIKIDCLNGFSGYCKPVLLFNFTNSAFLTNLRNFYEFLYTQKKDFSEIKGEISCIHKIIGNITNGDDFDTEKILEHGFLKNLCHMLTVQNMTVQREVCWILSNIAAGTSDQIKALLFEPNLFQNLVSMLLNSPKEIQREALWCICNMTKNCDSDQLNFLIENNVLEVFKDCLGMDCDKKILVLVLEAIPNLIEKSMVKKENGENQSYLMDYIYNCGMADRISELQRHPSDHVYEKSKQLLERYFDLEEY